MSSGAALEAKNRGNEAFAQKNYTEAVKHFTDAINLDPSNHVLYSNRSAAYASLNKWKDALQDANKTVELKPDWAKGYSRKGAAHHGLGQLDDAAKAYSKGLEIEPNNDQLKQGLEEVRKATQTGPGDIGDLFAQAFSGDVWTKLRMSPQTAPFLSQPDYVAMITDVVNNPKNVTKHLTDKRFMASIGVLLGLPVQPDFGGEDMPKEEPKRPEPKQPEKPKEEPKKAPEPEPMQVEVSETQKKAEEEKNKGNELYKNKKFDEAIVHYSKAIELDPDNITYITNRAAAHFEKGDMATCIKDCELAVETGRRVRADYKLVAKAYTRMGNAFMKQDKYQEAIDAYTHSLTEDRTPQTLQLLQKAEKIKEEKDRMSYIDPQKSLEAKERGNELFKQGKTPEAIGEYTEAIKRNPEDHVLYSNRAACYLKLGEYNYAIKDCDECIKRNPQFVKAYTRKGHAHYFLKEYGRALEVYDQGLKLDENNQEITEGINRTIQAMNQQESGKSDQERLQNAMRDPEVQEILSDPIMRQILNDMQTDPGAARDHLKNPHIAQKIQKLINAGVLKVGGYQ